MYKGVKQTASGKFSCKVYLGKYKKLVTRTFDTEKEAAVAYVHIQRDYLRSEKKHYAHIFSCETSEWRVTDTVKYTYIDDVPEFREERALIFMYAKEQIKSKNRARFVKKSNGEVAVHWPPTLRFPAKRVILRKGVVAIELDENTV